MKYIVVTTFNGLLDRYNKHPCGVIAYGGEADLDSQVITIGASGLIETKKEAMLVLDTVFEKEFKEISELGAEEGWKIERWDNECVAAKWDGRDLVDCVWLFDVSIIEVKN